MEANLRQFSMSILVSSRVVKTSLLISSSHSLPLKDSTYPFSQGLPSSMNRVVTPNRFSHSRITLAVNSGPLPDRRYSGYTPEDEEMKQLVNDLF